jgi:ubiquinone/menaquinone biosynthesis C-methylase UbiE
MGLSFDRIAPFYDTLAKLVFGTILRKSQQHFLHLIPDGSVVLIIGGGTGWIIPKIFASAAPRRLIYVEDSAEMLWRSYCSNADKELPITFVLGDEAYLSNLKDVDVVLTFYFLDVFKEDRLVEIMKKVKKSLRKNGLWLVADFNSESKNPLHRVLVFTMIKFFQFTSGLPANRLHHFAAHFKKLDFKLVQKKSWENGLLISSVYRNF